MQPTDREQKYISACVAVKKVSGEEMKPADLDQLTTAVHILLPAWDAILPLIVADIINAVKAANKGAKTDA